MDDNFEELVVDIRASTQGFASDLESVRGTLDNTLLDGLGRAGDTLERGLISALRKGSLGFDDLKRIALRSLDEIATHAIKAGLGDIFSGQSGGFGGIIGQSLGALLGLPGRATGGPVSPGRGYMVGERGPELFVPTSSGRSPVCVRTHCWSASTMSRYLTGLSTMEGRSPSPALLRLGPMCGRVFCSMCQCALRRTGLRFQPSILPPERLRAFP